MKKILGFAMLGLAAILSCSASALAQDGSEVVADIPFSFTVGQQHLAAGTYHFRTSGDRLLFRDAHGTNLALVAALHESKLDTYGQSAVRFVKEAGQFEFAGVQTAGDNYELQLANPTHHTHVEAYEIVKGK
ncbi:hypothetical protein Acid345_0978 [Candidatus Koribacter versatilis Ellin345]|uniref:Uncharacterized protein n=1 Tax=Koribacter versatilis (strain Ellin345) TaxID=204669 RepID=Q1IT19_KORVE|nr:hypothetical protein [Candidatus Koribacter versatilis]ABF39981.1 hypothetical protein Acid345_0978 [Candidatus Koribacter versatilis Ellin345]